MKTTRMKYNSIQDIEFILNRSGHWKKITYDEFEVSPSIIKIADIDTINSIYIKQEKNNCYKYKANIYVLIRYNLSFTVLISTKCIATCCGDGISINKFSMTNLYKNINKYISEQ